MKKFHVMCMQRKTIFFKKQTLMIKILLFCNGLYGIEYDLTLQDVDIYPYSFPDDYFDKFIYEISPKFVETYGQ